MDSTWCWKHFYDILVHDMIASHNCCKFVNCTFMLPISCSTTPKTWVLLDSGLVMEEKPLKNIVLYLWPWNPFETIHALQDGSLSCHSNGAALILKGPMCSKKAFPTSLDHHQQLDVLIIIQFGSVDSCCCTEF